MSDPIQRARENAFTLYEYGHFELAAKQFEEVLAKVPDDVTCRQKLAETFVRLGKPARAVEHYHLAMASFAHAGFFFKAIALARVILELDPTSNEMHETLTHLYGRSRHHTPITPLPQPSPLQISSLTPGADVAPPEPLATPGPFSDVIVLGDDVLTPVPPTPRPNTWVPLIPLFSDLTDDEFIAVLQGVQARVFAEGETIVTEGEQGESMFAIVEGEVSLRRVLRDNSIFEVSRLGEGDFFGEIALLSGGRRLASVVATRQVVAIEFNRVALGPVLRDHPGVARSLELFYRQRLLANLLRSNPLFQLMSVETREALSNSFSAVTRSEGDIIIEQGKPVDGLYMLLRGVCEVSDATGHRYPDLFEGDLFGEISLILEEPATATVKALGPVTALKLPVEEFVERVLNDPGVRESVLALASARMSRTNSFYVANALDVRV